MSSGYGIFDLYLKEQIVISPSILRCVFRGPEVHQMQRYAPDQRIKLLFPTSDSLRLKPESGNNWHRDYLSMPREQRPLMRTYTIRALRNAQQEMDVEFVLHGHNSPVSNWLSRANTGELLQVIAPKGKSQAALEGCEWKPSPQVRQSLLIADETALPAALGILEQLARQDNPPQVQAFFEVPTAADCINVAQFTFADVFWLPREEKYHYGERLLESVRQHAVIPESACMQVQPVIETDSPEEQLWERAEKENNTHHFYAWIAAESSSVKKLRHYFILERHLDRHTVNFMAYWSKSSSRGNKV